MTAVDLPAPVVVTRHQCPHCRRYTRANRQRVEEHMPRCWRNPAARACKTCVHFEPAVDGRCWGDPQCNCPSIPEGCAVDAAKPRDLIVVGCPQWESADSEGDGQ